MRDFRTSTKPSAPREFEELLSEHLDALYSSALRFCAGRSADAEDLLQALAAWKHGIVPDEYADAVMIKQRLTAALDTLDEDVRPVIWLSDVEGFRQREVAEMLGIPEGTVASRLFRARRALRGVLEQRMPDASLRSRHE